jgi:hypothetical protein
MLATLSVVFLYHGKTDLVGNVVTPNLAEPVYGFWYQFLGNMSGTWALIAAVAVMVSQARQSFLRLTLIAFLSTFAVNSKLVHALPLFAAAVTFFLFAPKSNFLRLSASIVGVFIGAKLNRWIAFMELDRLSFEQMNAASAVFMSGNLPEYTHFFDSPSATLLLRMIKRIPENGENAISFVGLPLVLLYVATVLVVLFSFVLSCHEKINRAAFKAFLAFSTSSIAVIIWWSTMSSAPTRFLSSAPPLIVAAIVTGLCSISFRRNFGGTALKISLAIIALIVFLQLRLNFYSLSASIKRGREARAEQIAVRRVVLDADSHERKLPLCGLDWWQPHETAFLISSARTVSCLVSETTLAVVAKHIYPSAVSTTFDSCIPLYEGRFYDVRKCFRGPGNSLR